VPSRVFIHGLESSAQGVKGAFFKEKYPDMIVEDFTGSYEERMAKLNLLLKNKSDLIMVGSSYGGLMAAAFARRTRNRTRNRTRKKIKKLILLAPALNHMPSEARGRIKLDFPVTIYHGSRDNVVPPGPVYEIARKMFTNLTYHLVDDDHSLHQTFFTILWDELLS